MEVKLLHVSQGFNTDYNWIHLDPDHAEGLAQKACSICIGKEDHSSERLQTAIESRHYSVLEHLPLTWIVRGVSRALLAQLSRHRHISLSVQSQRYCKIDTSTNWYKIPDSIIKSNHYSEYIFLMDMIDQTYNKMISDDIPKEDARYVLPEATFTIFMISMNARSFVEICEKRLCNKAQQEIRELFLLMKKTIKDIYPNIHDLCIPLCLYKTGCLESKPCGKEMGNEILEYI